MASFFGEISELSSRAVDDEEVDSQPKFIVHLETLDNQAVFKSPCQTGVFAVGEASSAFIKSYLLPDNAVAIAKVKCIRTQTDDSSELCNSSRSFFSPVGRTVAVVFLLDPNTLVCDISGDVPDVVATNLCDLLYKNFCCDLAMILTSVHIASYKTKNSVSNLQPRFLKSLSTSTFAERYPCSLPKLPVPNFVSGLPAALLSKFEARGKPALCIVNYMDSNHVDFVNSESFTAMFDVPPLSNLGRIDDGTNRLLRLCQEAHRTSSNLYI